MAYPLVGVKRLDPENELRIMTDDRFNSVRVKLESGLAEIYGVEMVLHKEYKFPANSSIAVFTWQGCTIRINGTPRSVRVVKDTLMKLNVILHAHLQECRLLAEEQGTKGPVILIVGPTDVGKSTLCRILLNYAARLGKRPVYVDLDVGQNSISLPGTIGILTINKPTDIVQGYEDKAAKVYHFGYKSPSQNLFLYFLLLKYLGNVIKQSLRFANPNVRSSGIIINTCGWIRGHGYEAITHAAMSFEINDLIVIGEERLYSQLLRDMPASVKVHFMPKLDGVVERNRMLRVKAHEAKIGEYFYGLLNRQPYCIDMHFSEIKIFKVVTPTAQDDFDPTTVAVHNIKLEPVNLSLQLIDQVLALMKIDIDEVITENLALLQVIGFVSVRRVYTATGRISLNSPQPRPLPSKILLLGEMKLLEQILD